MHLFGKRGMRVGMESYNMGHTICPYLQNLYCSLFNNIFLADCKSNLGSAIICLTTVFR